MDLLRGLPAPPPPTRDIYCNRTLNLRTIRAIGYDMDYTLIHYNVEAWERRAYEHIKAKLLERDWPVEHLTFDPTLMIRGLIVDLDLGNLVKANRFGYVTRAYHGTDAIEFARQRTLYGRTLVDLHEPRWKFINTLFSLSEGCIYAQLVELLDQRKLPGVMGYGELYQRVRQTLDKAHMAGQLKAEIVADPDRFVELDPQLPLTLIDQRMAGKKLLLMTNSEWPYTRDIMAYAFDRFLPDGQTWRDLFDVIIVSARKPGFFSGPNPLFEVIDEQGRLMPEPGRMKDGRIYLGGHAAQVEKLLGISGEELLYVGDHIYVDVKMSKAVLRWRTALVLRELEADVEAIAQYRPLQEQISVKMANKLQLEFGLSQLRLQLQRLRHSYGPAVESVQFELEQRISGIRAQAVALDQEIAPLAQAIGEASNVRWGTLMRAGLEKSHLARQVERYADIYTSRVSNFGHHTPYAYLRAPGGSLPHDRPGGLTPDPITVTPTHSWPPPPPAAETG